MIELLLIYHSTFDVVISIFNSLSYSLHRAKCQKIVLFRDDIYFVHNSYIQVNL